MKIGLRHILLGLLVFGVATLWIRERWALSALEAAVFCCSAARVAGILLRRQSAVIGWVPVFLAAVCLWGVLQLVEHWTVSPSDTVDAVLYWCAAVCFVWLGRQACATREDCRLFLEGALLTGSVICLAGIVQLFTSDGLVFWLFPSGYVSSVIGPFVNYNHFACFVELLLPIALVLAFKDQRYLLLAAGLAAAVVASGSRAGTLLVLAETLVVYMLRGRDGLARGSLLKLAVLAAAFTGILGFRVVWDRFWSDPDPLVVRREFLQSSLAMVRAEPLHGFGLGAWPSAYRAYAVVDTGAAANHAHNEWIEWAAEGGLPVVAVMAAILVLCLPAAVRSIWGLGIIAVFLHSLVEYPFVRLGLAAWIFVLIGALQAYSQNRLRPERAKPAAPLLPPWVGRLTAAAALPALVIGASITMKLAWADTLYRRATRADVQRAAVLAPDNAEYHFTLARLEPGRAVPELERSLALNPFLTNARIELAEHIEDGGDRNGAEAMLLEAARRDRQFAPAWALVNFYLRTGRPGLFWLWARKAADMSYGGLRPLFDLCFLMTSDARTVRDRAVPPKRSVQLEFLEYLAAHQRFVDADAMAIQIAADRQAVDREPLLNYIDQSLAAGRYVEARSIWNAMSGTTGGGLVNGDFVSTILDRGFDWRLPTVPGVTTAQLKEQGPVFDVELSGEQPEHCELLSQPVALSKAARYVLRFEYLTNDLPSRTGLLWSLGADREFALPSSPAWSTTEWRFTAPSAARLSLVYRRSPGTTRTEGALRLRHVRLDYE
jgi:O-antigen ligase